MSLRKCMAEHTEEELQLWMIYFDEDMNRPGKAESYAQSVATEVRRLGPTFSRMFGGRGDPNDVKLEDLRLKFEVPKEMSPETEKAVVEYAKQGWLSGLGSEVVHKRISRAEARARGMIE